MQNSVQISTKFPCKYAMCRELDSRVLSYCPWVPLSATNPCMLPAGSCICKGQRVATDLRALERLPQRAQPNYQNRNSTGAWGAFSSMMQPTSAASPTNSRRRRPSSWRPRRQCRPRPPGTGPGHHLQTWGRTRLGHRLQTWGLRGCPRRHPPW